MDWEERCVLEGPITQHNLKMSPFHPQQDLLVRIQLIHSNSFIKTSLVQLTTNLWPPKALHYREGSNGWLPLSKLHKTFCFSSKQYTFVASLLAPQKIRTWFEKIMKIRSFYLMILPCPIFLPFLSKIKSLWKPYHVPSVSFHSCINRCGVRKKLPCYVN